MFLRDTDFPTLGDVAEAMHDLRRTWSGSSVDVRVRLDEVPDEEPEPLQATVTTLDGLSAETLRPPQSERRYGVIVLGKHEVPATDESLRHLAEFYEVPYKFLERVPADEKQFILDHRIQRGADRPLVVKYNDRGISETYPGNQRRIRTEDIVQQLLDQQVFDPEAKVVEWWNTPNDFRLDVIVQEGHTLVRGDRQVGDYTHGGLRIGQNRKQNLAPWVQPYHFRLACTNGQEVPDFGLKVDARAKDEWDVIAELMSEARRAIDRVGDDIEHFYDLRNQKVADDATGLFRRMTRDLDLPDRTIGRMENTLQDSFLHQDEMTMFDFVNHITNQANDPTIRSRYNARRDLERAGGQMVADHAARCTRCHSRL